MGTLPIACLPAICAAGADPGRFVRSTLSLRITDLVDGYNAIQFACDQGSSFWGHFIVDDARLDAILRDDHPDLVRLGLAGCCAVPIVRPAAPGKEAVRIALDAPDDFAVRIERVEYRGFSDGYDENGDGIWRDGHGMTKAREPYGILGIATEPPFEIEWDLSMLPAQDDVAVKAIVRFEGLPRIRCEPPTAGGISIAKPAGIRVARHVAKDLPRPFWSRASKPSACAIEVRSRAPVGSG